jgi:hypothetical protein
VNPQPRGQRRERQYYTGVMSLFLKDHALMKKSPLYLCCAGIR